MNEIIDNNIKIEEMIYEIRGVQVMLDSDLAKLFETETKRINEAVKNNQRKFPDKYSWNLSEEESKNFLVDNFDQKNIETRGGRYKNPRVFTEHGIVMLSTILKSDKAIEMSVKIINSFVAMRHLLMDNKNIFESLNIINNKLVKHDEKINYLFSKFDQKEKLFYKNEYFTSYMNVLEILYLAKKEIIVIDNYADISFLDLIRNIKCSVILITKNSKRLSDNEIDRYNKEFNNLKVIRDNSFHDRYIVIDNNEIYHLGTSINNMGDKIFMITKVVDELVKNDILNEIKKYLNKYYIPSR